ncbi:MAG: serine/threonine protein kinase [Betaproteobacteria bacterium]|nr:serine/threonine protein kinase [Betaproteobacteria bacterium]
MDRDTWLKVEPLFSTALSLDGAARAAWLSEVETREPALFPVLKRLVDTHDRAERNAELETVPKLADAPPAVSPFHPGQRVGAFRLVSLLGRGGMGEVWRARQADGGVEREVALKLPVNAAHGAAAAERFRREKNILASLNHPRIAHLIDAGVSEDADSRGQPWLAMELVEGAALGDFLKARTHSLAARLALFRQILEAVAHAHRHLVVHRDLKPANILVDAQGQVKLLDFGIAKLVEDDTRAADATELTRLGGRAMTLRYCAPEQVAGGAISTATDIYALGVILFEMLTGASPYRAVRDGRGLTELAITTEDVARPSSVAPDPALAGDLDAIVLKALRRDPAERYATVEAFAADLDAHAAHRPVAAREGTRRYLLGRFVARHKWPIAAGVAVVVALGAGLGVAESQRRQAVAEKARAEQHFASVRELANKFVFDIHNEIAVLPGSLKAREKLVVTALDYLDKLAAESEDDAALTLELARAYRQVALIQGGTGFGNTGQSRTAVANMERSDALFVRATALAAGGTETGRQHRDLLRDLARIHATDGNARWVPVYDRAIALARELAQRPEATLADRYSPLLWRVDHAHIAARLGRASPQQVEDATAALLELRALAAKHPQDDELAGNLIIALTAAGDIHSRAATTPEARNAAITHYEQALAQAERIGTAFRSTPRFSGIEIDIHHRLAEALAAAGRIDDAARTTARGVALADANLARDPLDATARVDRIRLSVREGEIEWKRANPGAAVRAARQGLALYAGLPPQSRGVMENRSLQAELHLIAAQSLFGANPPSAEASKQACQHVRGADDFVREILRLKLVDGTDPHVAVHAQLVQRCGLAPVDTAKAP